MKSIGLVFLYDRNLGAPDEVSKKFSEFFSFVSENIVLEGLVELPELKEIMDSRKIYWAGIKQNFETILDDNGAIGKIAWKVFSDHSGTEPSEEVKSLVYRNDKVPWKFTLLACVLYE